MGSSLGAPKRYFPIKNLNRVDSLVVFFFLLGCFVLVFLDGLSISYLPYLKHGPVMIEDLLAAPGFVAFVLFFDRVGSRLVANANWSKGVVVYDRGFAIHDWNGLQLGCWEDTVSLAALEAGKSGREENPPQARNQKQRRADLAEGTL